MANPTTNYGFVLPTPTDLVTDLPADFDVALQGVDTQMLTNANAAIAKTIVDAKGDIIAATAADAVSRLAVGANNTVLTADSTTATGLKWAAAAAGGKVLQVVSATNATSVLNSTTTFADTNLTATITPTSNTSTILVLITSTIGKTAGDSNSSIFVNLLRGATVIYSTTNLGTNTALDITMRLAMNYVDNPATVSATTYKTQFRNNVAFASVSHNRNSDTGTITLMEIGA